MKIWKARPVEHRIRKLVLSLVGATAVAASILLVRQQRQVEPKATDETIPAGESAPEPISVDRLRELGI